MLMAALPDSTTAGRGTTTLFSMMLLLPYPGARGSLLKDQQKVVQRQNEACEAETQSDDEFDLLSGESARLEPELLTAFNSGEIELGDIHSSYNRSRSKKSGMIVSGSTQSKDNNKYGLTHSDGSNMSVMDFDYSALFS